VIVVCVCVCCWQKNQRRQTGLKLENQSFTIKTETTQPAERIEIVQLRKDQYITHLARTGQQLPRQWQSRVLEETGATIAVRGWSMLVLSRRR
jgi:hypothetical protein